jgi:hypothetical protein
MRLRLLCLTLLAYCSAALAADTAPPPRPVVPPGEVPAVMIPDDRAPAEAFRVVKLGAVTRAANMVSVSIPDDGAIRALKAQGIDVDPANPPLRKVYLGAVYNPNPPKAVQLADFMQPVRGPPAAVDYSPKALESIRRMYVNDQLGCCVISSLYHGLGVVSGNHGPTCLVVPDSVVRDVYRRWAYVPGQDTGCIISDVLDRQRDTGVPLADGSIAKTDGYVVVDNTQKELVKAWVHVFGGGPIGINLPQAWTAGGDGSTWDVPTGRGASVVGGHDVRVVGYTDRGVIISTWAGLRTITWAAFLKKPRNQSDWGVTECYAVLHPQWYAADNLAPNGVDVVGLRKALATRNPNVDPITPPPPPPPPGGFTGDVGVVVTFDKGKPTGVKLAPAQPVAPTDKIKVRLADGTEIEIDRAVWDAAPLAGQLRPTPVPAPPAVAVSLYDVGFGVMLPAHFQRDGYGPEINGWIRDYERSRYVPQNCPGGVCPPRR